MTSPTLSRIWGNPVQPTFKKRCIRRVTAGGTMTYVHADVQDIAAKLLDAQQRPGLKVEGWVAPTTKTRLHPRHYGIALRADDELRGAEEFGYRRAEDGWYVFDGDPEAAKRMTESAEAERMAARVEAEPKIEDRPEDIWATGRPGSRELKPGDKGDDVQFFQMVFNAPDQTGVFDGWCEWMARLLQERWGVKVTGTVDENVWKGVLPTSLTYSISYGDTGHVVRVLQAALLAYDWDYEVVLSARFDELTYKAVRKLQAEYGLRQSSEMSAAEWTILLGRGPRPIVP